MTDTPQPKDFDGKVALVTGASRGIGESTARLLAARGAHVIVSSRRQESVDEVAGSIVEAGGQATAIACHVGDEAAIEAAFARIAADFGRLDVLVNNAATNPHFGHIAETPLTMVDKTVEVNIRGYFHASQKAALMMRDGGGGAIVNVSSVNGERPGPMQGIYSITKAAVVSMTKAFAKACAPLGIRCTALLPGLTKSKFAGALFENEDIYRMAMEKIPMGRHAEPEEMAGTVLYLVSDAASYTNGECNLVDGGITL